MKNKVFRRFLRRKVSVVAAIILLTIILAAYSARCLSPPIPWSRIF